MERLKIYPENKGPIRQFGLSLAKAVLAVTGVRDPELKIQDKSEWERQASRFTELGFHNELKLTKEEYLASLPKFESQPKEYKGTLDTPLLVETRVPIQRQAKLAGIDYLLTGLDKKDWPDDPKQYKTPDVPYTTWTDEGARFMNRRVQDVRQELASFERGGTEFDGVASYIVKPQILEERFLDLPGTAVGSAFAAYLNRWHGQAELLHRSIAYAVPGFGSLVCRRKI